MFRSLFFLSNTRQTDSKDAFFRQFRRNISLSEISAKVLGSESQTNSTYRIDTFVNYFLPDNIARSNVPLSLNGNQVYKFQKIDPLTFKF